MSTSIRTSTECAGCWHWICDCEHRVEPLNIKRHPVMDAQIRSVGYDRRRARLEIEFTWTDDVRQFYPLSPAAYRQLIAVKPMYLFLHRILRREDLSAKDKARSRQFR
jgi:KTSC domain